MLLRKKKKIELQTITCTIQAIQEYPGKTVVIFSRGLTLDIPNTEQGWHIWCKLGYLAGLRGEFRVQELMGCKVSVKVFNNVITKITQT